MQFKNIHFTLKCASMLQVTTNSKKEQLMGRDTHRKLTVTTRGHGHN